jgi:hypothetical protein
MSRLPEKQTTPASLVVDAILVIVFFLFMYSFVAIHVPTTDPKMRLLWGGLCSACVTAVFWLCVQMFRVVLRAQRQDRK